MALCMDQDGYPADSVAAPIRAPHDGIEAVRPALGAMGGKIVAAGYPVGDTGSFSLRRYRTTPRQPASSWPWPLAVGSARAGSPGCPVARSGLSPVRKAHGSHHRPAR
jgi:hypothetical protein